MGPVHVGDLRDGPGKLLSPSFTRRETVKALSLWDWRWLNGERKAEAAGCWKSETYAPSTWAEGASKTKVFVPYRLICWAKHSAKCFLCCFGGCRDLNVETRKLLVR
jgi:hypothetical protein